MVGGAGTIEGVWGKIFLWSDRLRENGIWDTTKKNKLHQHGAATVGFGFNFKTPKLILEEYNCFLHVGMF